MPNTAHTIEEFADFPWNKLDEQWFVQVGGVARGGITAEVNFNVMKPTISFYSGETLSEFVEDRWEIPEQLAQLLKRHEERGFEKGKGIVRKSFQKVVEDAKRIRAQELFDGLVTWKDIDTFLDEFKEEYDLYFEISYSDGEWLASFIPQKNHIKREDLLWWLQGEFDRGDALLAAMKFTRRQLEEEADG